MAQEAKHNVAFCSIREECEGCPRLDWCSDGTILYLCDGEDPRCSDRDKAVCCRLVTGKPGCRHTPDPRHAISRIDPGFPRTECRPLRQETPELGDDSPDVWIEMLCDDNPTEGRVAGYGLYYDWETK